MSSFINPFLLTDFYKVHHQKMYPDNMALLYSNWTPRGSRIKDVEHVVVFGIQHFIQNVLIKQFNENFFQRPWEELDAEYKEEIDVDTTHLKLLHELGYLPLIIKALPEGTLCPIKTPMFTIRNSFPKGRMRNKFGWLVNYMETLVSCSLWQPMTSATIALAFKRLLDRHALHSTGSTELVPWFAHDFSMRGMSSVESAITSGMGHLLSFTGSDNIPAIYQLKHSYDAVKGTIGGSVPATEHSVMCMGEKATEMETFLTLMRKYPTGLLSVVSDTWDLWKVLTEYLPELKEEILARDGKLVIRPDSGDPVDILCGYKNSGKNIRRSGDDYYEDYPDGKGSGPMFGEAAYKGVIELLWDTFGGTMNEKGFKVLDSHIGAIYGDSITLDRAEQILTRLEKKGFAFGNVVMGIGSYTYQYNTRDTFGFAMKATYGEVTPVDGPEDTAVTIGRTIFKDPVTDSGTKKSARGLLQVVQNPQGLLELKQEVNWTQEAEGALRVVFQDGEAYNRQDLEMIRRRLIHQAQVVYGSAEA